MTCKMKKVKDGVTISLKVDLGFLNEKLPIAWNKRCIYVCLLCATSDGQIVHFARIRYGLVLVLLTTDSLHSQWAKTRHARSIIGVSRIAYQRTSIH